MINNLALFTVVMPAAGVGKRMQSACPKQYLTINGKTVLEHTVERLLSHSRIGKVIIAIGDNDDYFAQTSLPENTDVVTVTGGKERVDSVLAGLNIVGEDWVLVHDAARPCVTHDDLNNLISYCEQHQHGALLAAPVRDTMKLATTSGLVDKTLDRSQMWHALTPQMYQVEVLQDAIHLALANNINITDESSAIEYVGLKSGLVSARNDNIKITRPEDLALARFILEQQSELNTGIICE